MTDSFLLAAVRFRWKGLSPKHLSHSAPRLYESEFTRGQFHLPPRPCPARHRDSIHFLEAYGGNLAEHSIGRRPSRIISNMAPTPSVAASERTKHM